MRLVSLLVSVTPETVREAEWMVAPGPRSGGSAKRRKLRLLSIEVDHRVRSSGSLPKLVSPFASPALMYVSATGSALSNAAAAGVVTVAAKVSAIGTPNAFVGRAHSSGARCGA
jgi:hypothetical protein